MNLRLATLTPTLAILPANRDVAPANIVTGGSFHLAMNDARKAAASAHVDLPRVNKSAPGADSDKPTGRAATDVSCAAAMLAPLLPQLPPIPTTPAANMLAMPMGMQQAGMTSTNSHHDTSAEPPSHEGAEAMSGMNSGLAPRMSAPEWLAGLTPLPRALNNGPQDLTAGELNESRSSGSIALDADQGASSSAQSGSPSQGVLSSFTATLRAGHLNQADITASEPFVGAPGNLTNVMAGLADRSASANGQQGATLALSSPNPEHWKDPMLNALGERVQWQIQRGSEQANIRLEPPHLGQIDIVIRQEAGQMQVHLSATHREVAQQLQGISDGLRQELSLRQTADVQVQVSDQSYQGHKGSGQEQRPSQQGVYAPDPSRALSGLGEQDEAASVFSMQADLG